MRDPQLDVVVKKYPNLRFKPTVNEYRIFRPQDEGKGSLWIARQKSGYRIVSTGTAHSIDREIERLSGTTGREMSDRAHKWWKSISLEMLDSVLTHFARF